MPRPSMNPDRARQGGGGPEAGNYLVKSAKFQNRKTDFKKNQPTLVFECAVLDKDGDEVRGADDVELFFAFGEKSIEAFHPGQAASPNDEPQDQGDGVDAEGNTIYCAEEGAEFNASCGAIVFSTSLAKAGFPKQTLDRCWAPDYVGLKFALATKTSKEVNEKMGTRLSTKPPANDPNAVISYKIAEKWLNPNYLSKDSAKAGSSKANGKVSESEAPKPTDPEDIAKAVLAKLAADMPGKEIKTKQALSGFFTNGYTKSKFDPKKLKEVQVLVKDEEWLIGALAELGATYDEGVTTFAEA